MPRPSHSSRFYHPNNIGSVYFYEEWLAAIPDEQLPTNQKIEGYEKEDTFMILIVHLLVVTNT